MKEPNEPKKDPNRMYDSMEPEAVDKINDDLNGVFGTELSRRKYTHDD